MIRLNIRRQFLRFYASNAEVSKEIVKFYKKQGKEVVKEIDFTRAVQGVNKEVENRIYLKTGEFVKRVLFPLWGQAAMVAHSAMVKAFEKQKGLKVDVKQEADPVINYLNEQATRMIQHLSEGQVATIRAVLVKVVQNEISIYEAKKIIRGVIGLTEREANWVMARYIEMRAAGLRGNRLEREISRFALKLLKARAERILRTELANAWENSSFNTVSQLARMGYIKEVKKGWETAGDPRVCSICRANEEDGYIELEGLFSSGNIRPPAHPNCRCTLFYVGKEV